MFKFFSKFFSFYKRYNYIVDIMYLTLWAILILLALRFLRVLLFHFETVAGYCFV